MKSITFKHVAICLLALGIFFTACEKWIDPGMNVDPDSPENPNLFEILASAEANLAYTYGGFDVAGTTSMWLQYITGDKEQAKIIGTNYHFLSSDVTNLWNSIYAEVLFDLKLLIDKANEPGKESPHYSGAAKVLMAFTLGTATHLWGDIPYSQALQGKKYRSPGYDAQDSIYQSVQQLLNEALVELSMDPDSNFYAFENDMVYNADTEKWKKAAGALKMRYALHLTKRKGQAAYDSILYYAQNLPLMQSNHDDLEFYFGTNDLEANPMYQFAEQRIDDCVESFAFSEFVSKRYGNNPNEDLRREVFQNGENFAGNFYGSKNSPVCFMTYAEQLFILAEAHYMTGGTDTDTLLKQAVKASVEKVTALLEADQPILPKIRESWFKSYNSHVDDLSNAELYDEILTQKYIANFLQAEAFVDWRRTGIPELEPTLSGSDIPRRFPYSNEEILYNKNIPTDVNTIFESNWFDKE